MKKQWTALFCTAALILGGCGSSAPAGSGDTEKPAETATTETQETTEQSTSSRGGDGIKANDEGYAYGYIGDKMSNAFFDFTVNSAETAQTYGDYTAAEGKKLLIVDITLQNTFRGSLPMFASDFYVVYDWNSDPVSYADPINAENDDHTSGDMFKSEYSLAINETMNGVAVYEIPAESRDITLLFDEYFENEEYGDTYEVDFTVQ